MSGWPCWPAISQTCLTWGNTQNNTLTKISWQNYNFNYYQLPCGLPQMNFLMAVQWTFIGVILLTYRIIVESPTIVSIRAPPPPLERINISLVFENIFHVSSLLCSFYLLRQKEHYSHFPEVHIYSTHCTSVARDTVDTVLQCFYIESRFTKMIYLYSVVLQCFYIESRLTKMIYCIQ